jgi:hypothetical protein
VKKNFSEARCILAGVAFKQDLEYLTVREREANSNMNITDSLYFPLSMSSTNMGTRVSGCYETDIKLFY